MGLPRLAIKHPVSTLMLMLICIVLGVVSLTSTSMELLPKINPPVTVIMTAHPGASPQEVAAMVTEPIEAAVATAPGVTTISSTSQESVSLIIMQFGWGTNMSEARQDVQERLDRLRLPEGVQKPSLIKFDPNALPVMELAAADGDNLAALKARLEADVQPRLERIDGVAAVYITGAAEPEVQVLLNQEKLKTFGLTQAQISGLIQASNLTYPAGRINVDDKSLNLRIVGKLSKAEELKSLVVTMVPDVPAAAPASVHSRPDGKPGTPAAPPAVPLKPVRLDEIAEVREFPGEADVINRTNGKPSLRLTIQKEGEANTVEVSTAVADELEAIRRQHSDLNLVVSMNQGDIITKSVSNVTTSLLGGGALAIIVLLIFLRNLRPTFIIGVAIPFSVIVTFVLLFMGDLTLNIMTLGGLALGVGMLVDNAVVVIENIYRRLNELGEEPQIAAEKGANEVAGAITSSTLTTVAVFLPVVFVGGLVGELFKELALTVTFSLIASLAVALTVIPMLASRFLKAQNVSRRHHRHEAKESPYPRLLRWSLRNRAITLLVTLALFAGSVALVPQIGTEFMPVPDEGQFTVAVKMPAGTKLEVTAAKVQELAGLIDKSVDAELITTSAGTADGLAGVSALVGGGGGPSGGKIAVTLKDRSVPTADVIKRVRDELDAARGAALLTYNLESSTMNIGGSNPSGIQISVSGPDSAKVRELVTKAQEELAGVDGLVNLENNLDASRPELQVVVDREKALQRGLAPAQVAIAVADAVKGKIVTRLEEGGQATDVRVLYRPEDRSNSGQLGELVLKSPMGQNVLVKDVAEIKEALGPVSISRENQRMTVMITGQFEGRDLGSVTADAMAKIDALAIPDGYSVKAGGPSQMMSEGLGDMAKALILAILLVYMIMASQFESLLHPFTIMFTMPLAVIGVIAGLFVTGYALGITAMIGIIILAGIVVNNGIVLVDFVNQRRSAGMDLVEALVESGRTRLRPILMTALTTMLGLVPLALGIGEGAQMQAPMAITVIGGLLTSTVLTLVVVPVLYHLFAGRSQPAVVAEMAAAAEPGFPAEQMAAAQDQAPANALPLNPAQAEELRSRVAMSNDEFSQLLGLLGKLFTAASKHR